MRKTDAVGSAFRHNSWRHSANALKENFLSKNALPMNIVTLGSYFHNYLLINALLVLYHNLFIYLFLCMALRSLLSQPFLYACKSSIIGQLFFNRMTLNLLFTTTKVLQNC